MIKIITFILFSSAIIIADVNSLRNEENYWTILKATKIITKYDSTDNEYEEDKIRNILIVNNTSKIILKLNTTLLKHNDSLIDTFIVLNEQTSTDENTFWEPTISEIKMKGPDFSSISKSNWITFRADQTIIEYDSSDNDTEMDEIESILFFNSKTRKIFRLFSNDEEIRDVLEDKIDSTLDYCGGIKDITWEPNVKSIKLFTEVCQPLLLNVKKERYFTEYESSKKMRNIGIYIGIGGLTFTTIGFIWAITNMKEDDSGGYLIGFGVPMCIASIIVIKIGSRNAKGHLKKYNSIN